MNKLYSMPASHPAVHAGVAQLIEWGAPTPGDADYYDYVDAWGYPTHEVRFHSDTKLYDTIAGLLAVSPDGTYPQTLVIAYNEMKVRGMIDLNKPGPQPTPPPKQPSNPVNTDNVIGPEDPNRPGLYEPAAGTNPTAGDPHTTPDGHKWTALQVTFGFGGAAVNIRWRPN